MSVYAKRSTVVTAAIALVAVTAAVLISVPATGAPRSATLRIVTSEDLSRAVPTEGAVQELLVSLPKRQGGWPVLRATLYDTQTLTTRLRPGPYVVTFATRMCDSTCAYLDPPATTCQRSVTLRAGRELRAHARVTWGALGAPTTCRVTLRRA